MRDDGQISSVRKAMDILKCISDAPNGEINLKQLSERLGIPKPTCFHILNTLCACDYVERISHRGIYSLGPMSYYVTRSGKYQQDLIRLCYPIMNWIYRQTGQTVLLSVFNTNGKYIVHHINGARPFTYKGNIYMGHVFETATGRVLFCNLDEERQKDFIRSNGMPTANQWPEATTPADMHQEIQRIRTRRYEVVTSTIDDMYDIGIGTPISSGSSIIGAIGIALRLVPKSEGFPKAEIYHCVKHLLIGMREINHRLSFENGTNKD